MASQRWRRTPSIDQAYIDLDLSRAYNDASRDANFLRRASSINYLSQVTAPVQIHIGTDDTMTYPSWARQIRNGLQARGKEVEYFTYPGQGHALYGESWDLFMQRVSDFFDRHVKS